MSEAHEVPQKHLFDGTDLNVYETGNVVNLSAGAPGPDLLKECTNLFMKATEHRMVRDDQFSIRTRSEKVSKVP